MTTHSLEVWLRQRIRAQVVSCWLGAALALVTGLAVLVATFWFAYAVLFVCERGVSALSELTLNHRLRLPHIWRLVVCSGFIILLFAEWLRRSPWDLGRYSSVERPPFSNTLVFRGGALGGLAMMLANPQGSATMITELLYAGPRLLLGALHLIRRARSMTLLEVSACACVLDHVSRHLGAVRYEELSGAQPGVDWQRVKAGLACVDGVVFLENGLSMTRELREELLRVSAS